MKGIIALRMCDMSKYGGLPLEYGTVPAPVWRNIHPRLRMGTAARARAGVGRRASRGLMPENKPQAAHLIAIINGRTYIRYALGLRTGLSQDASS